MRIINKTTVGGALGLLAMASIGGMSARLATCKKDPTPDNAKAMVQGDTFTMAPCPIYLMEDDSVRGGFFRSPNFLNKLGSIDKNGDVFYLGGMFRASGKEDGKIRGSRGTHYGDVKDNGRVENIANDEIATIYDLENGNKTAGVKGAQKKALGVFALGI